MTRPELASCLAFSLLCFLCVPWTLVAHGRSDEISDAKPANHETNPAPFAPVTLGPQELAFEAQRESHGSDSQFLTRGHGRSLLLKRDGAVLTVAAPQNGHGHKNGGNRS